MQKQPSRKKAVITQSIGGYIDTGISIAQGLLLLPVYFKFIDISTYGYWITIGSVIALLSIVNFGIGSFTMQRISNAYAKRDFKNIGDYFINSLFLYILISILFIFLAILSVEYLETTLKVSNSLKSILLSAFYIAMITMVLSFFSNAFKGFSQSLLNPLFGVYSTIIARFIGIIVTVMLLYNNIGLLSIPIGLLVSEFIIFISNMIFAYINYKKLNTSSKLNLDILKEYLNFSPHLFGLAIGNKMTNSSHPLLITTFLGSEITTIYTVTRKVIEIILQSVNIINSSLIAPISHLIGEGDNEKIRNTVLKVINLSFFSTLLLIAGYISSNHTFVTLWLGVEKVLSNEIIMFIGLGALSLSMTRVFRSILFGFNEFKLSSFLVLLEGIFFVLSSVFMIKLFGIIGIAYGLFFSSTIVAIFMYSKILKKLSILLDVKSIFVFVLFLILCYLFIHNVQQFYSSNIDWFVFVKQSILTIASIAILEIMFHYNYLKAIYKGKK